MDAPTSPFTPVVPEPTNSARWCFDAEVSPPLLTAFRPMSVTFYEPQQDAPDLKPTSASFFSRFINLCVLGFASLQAAICSPITLRYRWVRRFYSDGTLKLAMKAFALITVSLSVILGGISAIIVFWHR